MENRPDLKDTLSACYHAKGEELEDINIFGVRRNAGNSLDDKFVDMTGIMTGSGEVYTATGTTRPGKPWTEKPVTWNGVTGAAHIKPGFYPRVWCVGIHGASNPDFKHTALIQVGTFAFWRDTDKDGLVAPGDPEQKSNAVGMDFHRASKIKVVQNIGLYGAGCQVVPNVQDFEFFMSLILNSQMYRKDVFSRFSYLLLTDDIIDLPAVA